MSTDAGSLTAPASVQAKVPWVARIMFLSIFVSIFFIALWVAQTNFSAARVSNNISITILAYSIYVAAFCGLAVFVVEAIHHVFTKSSGWENGWPFAGYIILTMLPVVYGTHLVSELATKIIEAKPEVKEAVLQKVEWQLDLLAPTIVVAYLVADAIGWKFGNNKRTFSWLVPCDFVVLGCHLIALLLLALGERVWLFGDFPPQTRAGLYAGIIAVVLLLQNVAFAIVTSFKR